MNRFLEADEKQEMDWAGDPFTITRVEVPEGEYLIEVPDVGLAIHTDEPTEAVNKMFTADAERIERIEKLEEELAQLKAMDRVEEVLSEFKEACFKAVRAVTNRPRHASVTKEGRVAWGG